MIIFFISTEDTANYSLLGKHVVLSLDAGTPQEEEKKKKFGKLLAVILTDFHVRQVVLYSTFTKSKMSTAIPIENVAAQ